MKKYFDINYEFDREMVLRNIDTRLSEPGADYISVADGVILDTTTRSQEYRQVINSGMFAICDSSYVPIYIKMIHGHKCEQYCGSQIFADIVSMRKYRMIFLGADQATLDALRTNLLDMNPDVADMQFVELPFCTVDGFDYGAIADMVNRDGADIIWVALGAPKQEIFMNRLRPFLNHGVMIAVGAAFKFHSGVEEKRAPKWMIRHHLEFLYRIKQNPKKQFKRCAGIAVSLPGLLFKEWRKKVHDAAYNSSIRTQKKGTIKSSVNSSINGPINSAINDAATHGINGAQQPVPAIQNNSTKL